MKRYKKKLRPLHLQMCEMPRLEGVGGNPVPTLVSTEVSVDIGVGTYKATVMVSARRERPNFIIGANFLSAHDCDLSLREKLFLLGEQKIECIPEKARVNHVKLKLARHVELPPHTEVLVNCKVGQSTKYFGTPHMVAQPSGNSWHYAEDGLIIGSSLLARDSETHCIPVMNLSNVPRTLFPDWDVYPVTSLKQAHEVLKVDPQLSDWDSEFDSDDEELLDVRTANTAGFSRISSRSNMRNDARMDPKDLPEHIQPLMQDLADDVTLRGREELVVAIYGYRDVFSSGPADMGRTDLVTHMIDTGEHRPIRLPPRRLPITKQEVECAEVQKMLDIG